MKKKRWLLFALIMVLLAAWLGEVIWVNAYYRRITDPYSVAVFHQGDIVELGTNIYGAKQKAEGCIITVDSAMMQDYDTYIEEIGFEKPSFYAEMEQKVLLVEMTLMTGECENEYFVLNDFIAHGTDRAFYPDLELMQFLNPEVGEYFAIPIEKNETYHLRIPFVVFPESLPFVRDHLEQYPIRMVLTFSPVQQEVALDITYLD